MHTIFNLIGGFTLFACFTLLVAGSLAYLVLRQIQRERRVRSVYRVRLAEYRRAVNTAAESQ